MENSRTKNSLMIMASGVGQKLVNMAIGFISRKIFIVYLGMAYVGINALFSNVLSLLSLAELGLGSAITVYLYKPLANKDEEEIRTYMHFYKKCYAYVGTAILVMGLSLVPLLPHIVNFDTSETPDVNLYLVYFLFLANSVASYWFFAYKASILTADQKEYHVNNLTTVYSAAASIAKCVVVILTRKFILALITELAIGIVKNIMIARKADEIYPFLKKPGAKPVPKEVLDKMFKDVRALFLSTLSFKLFSVTDNLIISTTLTTTLVGYADNYTMIINYVVMMIAMVTASLTSSIGNLNAKEGLERRLKVFRELDLANFWISSVSFVCLFCLLTPFVQLVFGMDKGLQTSVVLFLSLHFYMGTANNILNGFKTTMGVLRQGCYLALFGGVVNIILSFLFVRWMGLPGIYLATIVAEVFTTFFPIGYYTFHFGFKLPCKGYVMTMAGRMALTLAMGAGVYWLCSLFGAVTWLNFILRCGVCALLPNLVLLALFGRGEAFKGILERVLRIVKKRA